VRHNLHAFRMAVVLSAAVAIMAGCNAVTPLTSQRTLTFSVPKCLFGAPTATNPADQGPGIDTAAVTVSLTGGSSSSASGSLAAFTSPGYASFTIPVDGRLTSVTASGTSGGAEVVGASVTSYSPAEMARYSSSPPLGNLTYFKLDWSGGDSTTGTLRILPCPRSSAAMLVDSGAQTGTYAAGVNTDRFSSLQALQVAVEPVAAEDNTDATLTYTMYYAVSDVDPSVVYSPATLNGTYLAHPWTAQWTYGEVTSAGKKIGDTTFAMKEVTATANAVGVPDSNGKLSTLIDLTGSAKAGQYLLYCAVLSRGGLAVPTDVGVVQIR
jgi:hypothetical protein